MRCFPSSLTGSELQPEQAYFWATRQGAELDLLLFKNGRRLGIEIKRADAATITASTRSAHYELEAGVRVLPIDAVAEATVDALFPKKQRARGVAR